MVGLVVLTALIVFIARALQHGDTWPLAILGAVKHLLLGTLVVYGVLIMLAVGVGTTRAILHPVTDAMIALVPDGEPAASRADRRLEAPAAEPSATVTLPVPTPTPRVVIAQATQPGERLTATSLSYEAVGAPLHTPVPTPGPTHTPVPAPEPTTPPTATPTPARSGCDPAYPDARTCILPGPPWDQGCAITDERRFTVLPPDPQGLDHDGDGIGCEPVA